jgi:PAS domain S-box-containing protein
MLRTQCVRLVTAALLATVVFWLLDAGLDSLYAPGTSFAQSLRFGLTLDETLVRISVWVLIWAAAAWQWFHLQRTYRLPRKDSKQYYSDLFQYSAVALFRSSCDGAKLLLASERAAQLLGYRDVPTLLKECQPLALYADSRSREQFLNQLQSAGHCDGFDVQMNLRDGRQIWVRLFAVLNPAWDAIDGCLIDITAERAALDKLHESEQLHRAIIANSPLGISVRDPHGKLLQCNAAWIGIWNMSADDVRQDMEYERTELAFDNRDDYLGQRSSAVRRVYKLGGIAFIPDCQTHLRRPGMASWVSQYFYAICSDSGQVERVVIITEDISGRKQAEHERDTLLEELQKNTEQIKLLSGLLPVCSNCQKIRDDSGYWQQVDTFLQKHSPVEVSHSLCPECMQKLFPNLLPPEPAAAE